MSDGTASTEKHDHEEATLTRRPWIRPAVTKMDAADAEVGTRPSVADGAFSVS